MKLPFLRAPADGLEWHGLEYDIVYKEAAVIKRTGFGPNLKGHSLTRERAQVHNVLLPATGVFAYAEVILIHHDAIDEDAPKSGAAAID